ncbi:MAG: RNA 2',3'-cyclic phosphodiesterase [Tepidisphaeraceae bacterium]|jgi:2'-5' RNA ligase
MRLFTAVELPVEALQHLRRLQDSLRPLLPGVRWTAPDNLHITLKFLGETPDTRVNGLCEALKLVALEPAELHVAGLTCFPPRGPVRIIAAELEGDVEAIVRLFTRVEEAAVQLGFPREGRQYHPHITLARARYPVHAGVRGTLAQPPGHPGLPGPKFTTSGFTLFESRLSAAGATYVPLLHRNL